MKPVASTSFQPSDVIRAAALSVMPCIAPCIAAPRSCRHSIQRQADVVKAMSRPFDDTTRRNIAELCNAFVRAPVTGAATDLKRAAVAIALTHAEEQCETALLLTRRAAGLRAHRAKALH